jgi:hypothetical protein
MSTTGERAAISLEDVAQATFEMWRTVDERRTDLTVTYCAEDFVMAVGGRELDLARFRELMAARAEAPYDTRHVLQNLHVVARDEDSVTVAFVSTVWRLEPGADFPTNLVGDVVERWRREGDGELRLVRRELSLFCDTRPLDDRRPAS